MAEYGTALLQDGRFAEAAEVLQAAVARGARPHVELALALTACGTVPPRFGGADVGELKERAPSLVGGAADPHTEGCLWMATGNLLRVAGDQDAIPTLEKTLAIFRARSAPRLHGRVQGLTDSVPVVGGRSPLDDSSSTIPPAT